MASHKKESRHKPRQNRTRPIPARKPTFELPEVGSQLRLILAYLRDVESYIIVARMALDGQDAEQDCEIAALLQRVVGAQLFAQITRLSQLASKCDGRPNEYDPDESAGLS